MFSMLILSMTFRYMITLSAVLIGPVKSGSRVIIMQIRCITSGVAGNNQYVISFFHKELTWLCRFIRSRIHQAHFPCMFDFGGKNSEEGCAAEEEEHLVSLLSFGSFGGRGGEEGCCGSCCYLCSYCLIELTFCDI